MNEPLPRDIIGFPSSTGEACIGGGCISEMRERAGKEWPWDGPRMVGECRVALAWPRVNTSEVYRPGCMAVGVLAPNGLLCVPVMLAFDTAHTRIEGEKVFPGVAMNLATCYNWGARKVSAQANRDDECRMWVEIIEKDATCRHLRIQWEPVVDMGQAMQVFHEHEDQIVFPRTKAAEMSAANSRGEMLPGLLAVAMLAMSYRFGSATAKWG